jgi:hypothetical protein
MDGQLLHGAFQAACTNSVFSEIHLLVHIHQWHAHSLATLVAPVQKTEINGRGDPLR